MSIIHRTLLLHDSGKQQKDNQIHTAQGCFVYCNVKMSLGWLYIFTAWLFCAQSFVLLYNIAHSISLFHSNTSVHVWICLQKDQTLVPIAVVWLVYLWSQCIAPRKLVHYIYMPLFDWDCFNLFFQGILFFNILHIHQLLTLSLWWFYDISNYPDYIYIIRGWFCFLLHIHQLLTLSLWSFYDISNYPDYIYIYLEADFVSLNYFIDLQINLYA